MQSEGPYGIKNSNHWWHVDDLGEEQRLNQWAYKMGAEWWASKLNSAYAEGRKAAEKDFEELLMHANAMAFCSPSAIYLKFLDWKRARGIE